MRKQDKIMITLGIAIPVLAFLGYYIFLQVSAQAWPKTVERFYNENKQTLNEFVELCYDEDIVYIDDDDNNDINTGRSTLVNGYYVYSDNELNPDTVKKLSGLFDLFKRYQVFNISISDGDYFAGVLFGMGGFGYSVSLEYTQEIMTIEEIKKANFYKEVWYIDDHWYIGYGD